MSDLLFETLSLIYPDVRYRIGDVVLYKGSIDEIEAYCPLSVMKILPEGKSESKYVEMGYNLKNARLTVTAKAIEKIG